MTSTSSARPTPSASMTNTNWYSLSHVKFISYLLATLALLWFAEIGSYIPRNLRLSIGSNNNIQSINILHTSSDYNQRAGITRDNDIQYVASEMALSHIECAGKQRLIEILLNAGKEIITSEDCAMLPTWDEVTSLYGKEPIIHGLETCEQYRANILEAKTQPDPRVAGLFDTGTNAFTDILDINFLHRQNILQYQAPGGKHTLLEDRKWLQQLRETQTETKEPPTFLPIVLIRDPFRWMSSMCKAGYKAEWVRGLPGHCPNLVPTAEEQKLNRYRGFDTYRVDVDRDYEEYYPSLADMWSIWNKEFVSNITEFPRLVIRFEDTLFHAEKVMESVTHCLTGQPMQHPFQYHLAASKSHGNPADFITALAKYGTERGRYDGLAYEDKKYIVETGALNPYLMHKFHYPPIQHPDTNLVLRKYNNTCHGKEKVIDILIKEGLNVQYITHQECDMLPLWEEVTSLYGEEPIVHGLETCQKYRDSLNGGPPSPKVAGMFDTGTNAFQESLDMNFEHVDSILDYVLKGGKHVLLRNRIWAQEYIMKERSNSNSSTVSSSSTPPFMPVVLIRDPFRWMKSMCKKPYKAQWQPGLEGHCPNLVPNESEKKIVKYQNLDTYTVNVDRDYDEQYDSLADYWSEWYREYVDIGDDAFPRLIIRFEDTLFHAEKVMQIVSECVGKPLERPFKYYMDKSKHGSSTDFAFALVKYGTEKGRYDGLFDDDKLYTRTALDPRLMNLFHYPSIPENDVENILDEKIQSLTFKYESCQGKEHLLKILLHAGERAISSKDCQAMPKWEEVTSLYGDGPIIHGLETCQRYRDALSSSTAQGKHKLDPDPRVAGLFNTGTNALVDVFELNFKHVKDRLQYHLPGGKHAFLGNIPWAVNVTRSNPVTFLPIVIVRDPFRWMASMCKSSYSASWTRIDDHCPNLIKPATSEGVGEDDTLQTYTVKVERPSSNLNNETYESLADMWSTWYRAYFEADFPRLMIRFEDTLFHAEKVMQAVNECVGVGGDRLNEQFHYHLGKSKKGPSSDFPTALGKYGSERGRYDGMIEDDKTYVRTALNADLMTIFHYPQVPTPTSSGSTEANDES